jgi:YHS domain-containing protein
MKMQAIKIWLALALVFGLVGTAMAQPPQPPPTGSGGSGQALLNLDNTVALHGYDPVAYFTENQAVKGNKRILERLGSATYYFASRGSRYEFLGDAPRYQPQFGGYCAASMAMGRLEDINPHLFVIFEGKLYLFNNPDAEAMFMRDPRRITHEAREHYFKIAARQRSFY